MGRALYSHSYAAPAPAVAIRTEPEIVPQPCEHWTSWDHFDPDSEEFFRDAEYEAFITPNFGQPLGEYDQDAYASSDSGELSRSSSRSEHNRSPMAVGADDPAVLIADIYTNHSALWTNGSAELVSPTDPEWSPQNSLSVDTTTGTGADDLPALFSAASPASEHNPGGGFIPPPLNLGLGERPVPLMGAGPRSPNPILRRTMGPVVPITITRTQTRVSDADDGRRTFVVMRPPTPDSEESSSPSEGSEGEGDDGEPRFFPPRSMMSPSPPPPNPNPNPTLTPLQWSQHVLAWPHSARSAVDGPLTNPRARLSAIRIDPSPARIRVPSTV